MPLTRIESDFVDLTGIEGIDFDVQSGVPTLKVEPDNHRVGIGHNTPAFKLDVVGDINVSSGSNFLVAGSQISTANVAEDSSYLYYTNARVDARIALQDLDLSTKSTSDLAEGTNLYYTDARARSSISVTDSGGDGSLSYNSSTGVITYTGPNATSIRTHFSGGSGISITSGSIAIVDSVGLSGAPTAPTAAAGTNTTQIATTAFVSTGLANLVDSAPGALDTLNELAAALGDDANFSTTITNSIATKLPLAGGQMTGDITFSGSQTVDGRDLSADGSKLDGIEASATADQTAAEILTAIKTVDGSDSGLDADTVDGIQAASFLRSDVNDSATGTITFTNNTAISGQKYIGYNATYNYKPRITGGIGTRSEVISAASLLLHADTDGSGTAEFLSIRAGGGTANELKIVSKTVAAGQSSSALTYNGGQVWHAGNDGSSSGLDADTLDGLQGSSFLRSNSTDDYGGGTLTINSHSVSGAYQGWGVKYSSSNWRHTNNNSYGYAFRNNATTMSIKVSKEAGTTDSVATFNEYHFSGESTAYIKVGSNTVWHAGNDGSGSGLDADTVDGIQGGSFLRSDAADSATGTYSFSPGAFSSNVTYGGRSIQVALDINSTSMRGGVLVRNANDYRSETESASFMHYDAYSTSTTSYAFRASKGTTLADTFWVKGDGSAYLGNNVEIRDGALLVQTGGNNTYGVLKGYDNDNHFLGIRCSVANQSSLSITGANKTSFVEYAQVNDTTGWYWLTSHNNYSEVMRLTRTGGLKVLGDTVWHAGNDGSGSGLDADLLDGQQGSYYLDYTNLTNVPGGGGTNASTLDNLDSTQFLRSDAADTSTATYTFTNTSTTIKLDCSGHPGASSYNYFLRAKNDTGSKAVHFVNGSTRTGDGGSNTYTIRNDGGSLRLGKPSYSTLLEGSGDLTYNANEVWHAGNDGSGSGLDADLLDGIQSADIAKYNDYAAYSTVLEDSGFISYYNISSGIPAAGSNYWSGIQSVLYNDKKYGWQLVGQSRNNYTEDLYVRKINNNTYGSWSRIWTAASDGSGSGLDADTLDGQQGSYYQNATNLTSGTIPDARIPDVITPITRVQTEEIRANGTQLVLNAGEAAGKFASQTAEKIYLNAEGGVRVSTPSGGGNFESGYATNYTEITGKGIYFREGTTRVGEITSTDTTWLRINQDTAINIYTPRYIRADGGFFVDGTAKGINGSGNFIGGTIAGASDYSTLLRSNANDTLSAIITGHASDTEVLRVRSSAYSSNYVYIGGWSAANSNNIARIRSSSNFHIDSPANGHLYFNWYASNKTIHLGNTGQVVKAAGSNTVWHAGNDGSGSGLDADTLDGLQASSFLLGGATDEYNNGQLTIRSNSTNGHYWGAGIEYQSGGWKHTNADSWGFVFRNSAGVLDIYSASEAGTNGGAATYKPFRIGGSSSLLQYDGNNVWHAGNDGSGSGLDADTLDGIGSGSFLRSDATDSFSGNITFSSYLISNARDKGLFGTYDSAKTDHIWSMGTSYRNASDGSDFGNLYGIAYKHTTNTTGGTMGGGHQMVWVKNGTPKGAIGESYVWHTSGMRVGSNDVWHAGNDGASSGLDADTVDGIQAASFLRSDANDTATGTLTFNGRVSIRGHLDLSDGENLDFGSSDDVRINYNSNNWLYCDFRTGNGIAFRDNGVDTTILEDSGIFRPQVNGTGSLGTSSIKWGNVYATTFTGALTGTASGNLPLTGGTLTGDLTVPSKILHAGDSDTYIQFDADNKFRVVCQGGEVQEWGNNYTLINDDDTLRLGNGSDFQMRFNGSDTYFRNYAHANGDIIFQGENSAGTNQNILIMKTDGTRTYNILYENNGERFRTNSTGVTVTGVMESTGSITLGGELNMIGSSDANKYIDCRVGSNSLSIRKTTGGDAGHETMAKFVGDGGVELYHNNVKKFETTSSGATLSGILNNDTTDSYDKIRVYDSDLYTIGFKSAQTHGALNDYAMTFTMNNDSDRGWLWRDTSHAASGGAMSLTTNGSLAVSRGINAGGGETDTGWSDHPLHVDNSWQTGQNNSYNTVYIDADWAGTAAFTANRTQYALRVDQDNSKSNATSVSGNRHTTIAVGATSDCTGYTHDNRGLYGFAKSSAAGDGIGTQSVFGAYTYAQAYAASGAVNAYGLHALAYRGGSTSGGTLYGVYARAQNTTNGSGKSGNAVGGYFEVECDEDTIADAKAVVAHIDRDAGTVTTGYLFYGSYAGTVGTKWGTYVTGETKSYFSGNVGIGSTDPVAKLDVNGNIHCTKLAAGTSSNPGTNVDICLGADNDTGFSCPSDGNLKFWCNNAEVASWTASTLTFAKAATFNGRVNIRGHLDLSDNEYLYFGSGDDVEFFCNGSHMYMDLNSGIGNFYIRDGSTTRYTFNDNGSFTATGNVTAYSDIKLKENIEPIANPLDKVNQINGVTFDRIDTPELGRQMGVIAQDVEKVCPELVSTDEEGTKSVAYGNMVGLLIEAIKDQQKQIDELKAKLEEK